MLDKMLLAVAENEPETTSPEYDEDASYWDVMDNFRNVNTDYFSITVRTF